MTEAEQKLKIIIPAEQIEKRVREMARQISDDYRGKTVHVLGDSGERVRVSGRSGAGDGRAGDLPVHQAASTVIEAGDRQEIFFSHDLDIRGQHVLLVEGLVHSGVTADFLMNDLRGGERRR